MIVGAVAERAVLSPSLTFRGNLRATRHGWLRLTPAYSVDLVRELVAARTRPDLPVLDPFCGTGTTLLTCAELGIGCYTIDINPFLRWLAETKGRAYSCAELERAGGLVVEMALAAGRGAGRAWVPALHQIEKWWDAPTLDALSRAFAVLSGAQGPARDLAALSFCQALVGTGNLSFRHQSMSFRERAQTADVANALAEAFVALRLGAALPVSPFQACAQLGDSRDLAAIIPNKSYGSVITSPPYVNRMSYIRELRPYMYWLGFLADGAQAGELDWRTIGGTWGVATSKLARWQPETELQLPRLRPLLAALAPQSQLLARYVERYFCDMDRHIAGLGGVLASGARVSYVLGNSKFYDVLVPVQTLFADLFSQHGFADVQTRVLRRRTSKKELFEYLVSASWG